MASQLPDYSIRGHSSSIIAAHSNVKPDAVLAAGSLVAALSLSTVVSIIRIARDDLPYCCGGIGARDDDGAAGGLRAGAAGGCGSGSLIFKISATADCSLAMSRAIER